MSIRYSAPASTLCAPVLSLAQADAILRLISDNRRIARDYSLDATAATIEAAMIEAIDLSPELVEIETMEAAQ